MKYNAVIWSNISDLHDPCVAFEVFCMCLVYTPDGVILVSRYCVTYLNLLFSNSRVQIYI